MNGFGKIVAAGLAASFISVVAALALDVPANHIVDAEWLKANKGDKNLVIVDIRKKDAYVKEHIPGSVHWDKGDYREGRYYSKKTKKDIPGYIAAPLTFERTMTKSGVNNDSAIVFYADGTKAKDYRDSALGDLTCEFYGFDNIAVLNGGLAGWKKAGGEVTDQKSRPAKGNFSFEGRTFNHGVIATGEHVDEALATGAYQLVDANGKDDHWYGKSKDDRRLKDGHLPGAIPQHTKELAQEKDGVWYMGDKAFVEAAMKKSGIDITKPILWYCNTGHLISGNWFVAKYVLGMKDGDNRAYNGSMADYSRWPKRKFVTGD